MKKANLKAGFRIDYIGIGLISLGLGSMQIVLDKGSARLVLVEIHVVFFVLMLVGIVAGILWELRQKEPVIDLRMLKERNFAVATGAMFFLGFVLYSSTVLIPQFLQQLLIHGATGGMALSPGGAVIMLHDAHCGNPGVQKVDTRASGHVWVPRVCVGAVCMAGWDLGLDYGHAVRARMLQTFGLGVSVYSDQRVAFAYVPKEKSNMGTGIINLARTWGRAWNCDGDDDAGTAARSSINRG